MSLGVAFTAAVSGVGCDRNTEPFVEGEKPRPPDLARIFPEADASSQRDVRPPAPGPAAGVRRGISVGEAAAAPSGSTTSSAPIRGTIAIAPDLGSPPAGALLFVIARAAGISAGPPLSVLRIPSPHFPAGFEIGPANVMVPSMRFEGDIELSARLDSDGNATTKLPGDLVGTATASHRPGDTAVALVLDRRLP